MTRKAPKKVVEEFLEKRPLYEAFSTRLIALAQDLLGEANIDIAHIEARAKTVESFREKIQREGKSYENPMTEVTDLCGLRIILYTLDDVSRAADLIRNEFTVDAATSIDKFESMDPDRFGYLSVHYVAALTPARAKLREWKQYQGLKAEIQVRTILQHAWAAIDHKLRYKSALEVPRELRRELFRLSALLELADSEFSQIRQRSNELYNSYVREIETKKYDIEVNLDSLNAYLTETNIEQELQQLALKLGYLQPKVVSEKHQENARSRLLTVLSKAGINSIAELNGLLIASRETRALVLREVKEHSEELGQFVPFAIPIDLLTFLIVGLRRTELDDDTIKALKFKDAITESLISVSGYKVLNHHRLKRI